MTRQTMLQAKKESQPLQTGSLFRRQAAQAPVEEHDIAPLPVGFGRDYSHIPFRPPQPPPPMASVSCPFSPQRCPFGGACHACPPKMQAKLKIGQPGDRYEQEADRVAEQVMRMPEPQVQRKGCSAPGCKEEDDEKKLLQTKPASAGEAGAQADHPLIQSVLSSPGQPLDAGTRSFMEPRFGQDFSGVRVHLGGQAAESARAVNARAYTVGRDVVFGEGQYAPGSDEGKRLVAHELAHVGQQDGSHRRNSFPIYVQRFESHEHVQLGDTAGGPSTGFILLECHNRDLPQHASPVTTWPQTWQTYFATLNPDQQRALQRGLTYGEIVALTGDMYVDFQALNRAPLREVIDLISRIRSATTTTQDFQAATGGRYLELAKENIGHFSNVPVGQRNRDIWRRNHIAAIMVARTGNANVAWGLNAASDHYLTDAFSGGHLRVERALLHAQGTSGDGKSKISHDLDNQFGVEVTNDRGDTPWIAYGDEHLNDAADARNRTLAQEAVQLSKQDIADALSQGASYLTPTPTTVFSAERLIPRPVNMRADRWTKLDWIGEAVSLVASEAGIASELTEDDNRVRNWINRMDVSALARQSETDVTRMLNVLLSGAVSDDDIRAIKRLLGSVTDATMMKGLLRICRKKSYNIDDIALRTRFRIEIDRALDAL